MIRAANVTFLSLLGIWVGGMGTLGFIVAPVVFRTLPSRLQAGTTFGAILQAFGTVQLILGIGCLGSLITLWLAGGLGKRRALMRGVAVVLMLGLVLLSQTYLAPEIVRERQSIAGFDSIPTGTPQKARFDRLHRASVQVAVATLVLGVVLLVSSTATVKPSDGS